MLVMIGCVKCSWTHRRVLGGAGVEDKGDNESVPAVGAKQY